MISFLLQQRIKIDSFEKEAPVNHARGKLNDSIKIKNNFLFYSICTNICQRQIGLLIVLSSYWKPNTKKIPNKEECVFGVKIFSGSTKAITLSLFNSCCQPPIWWFVFIELCSYFVHLCSYFQFCSYFAYFVHFFQFCPCIQFCQKI